MSTKHILCLTVLAGVLLSLCIPVEAADVAQIMRVDRTEEKAERRNPVPRRIAKFADERAAAVREVYTVEWAPPAEGLKAGSILLFDYKQPRSGQIHTLRIQYPFSVRSQRKATFVISEKAVRSGGQVSAWRVRLMMGGEELASRTSATWR
jgi:hypothetical protein